MSKDYMDHINSQIGIDVVIVSFKNEIATQTVRLTDYCNIQTDKSIC